MILIISASWDAHPAKIHKAILDKHQDCKIFFTDEYSSRNYIKYFQNKIQIIINSEPVNIGDITSVFVRHPFEWAYNPVKVNDDRNYLEHELRRKEVNDIVKSLIHECERRKIFVIYNFENPIEFKLSNYLRAKEIGFNLPYTIISNEKNTFLGLKNSEKEFIIKPFVSRTYFKNRAISKEIMPIKGKDLYKKFSSITSVPYPLQIQERIDKQLDLRITIAGKQVFTCALYSQENPLTTLDSGKTLFENLRHESYQLPKEVENLCFELCRRNNLNHAAIDMALDKNGKYVFFELNPYGEYLWIEEKTGLPISEGMANLLMYPDKYRLV